MAVAIVIAMRLILPLSILRWPLAGGLLAMLVDALDVVLVDALAKALGEAPEFGPFYAQIDKWLDMYYLSLELVVSRRWIEPMLRRTAAGLYAWRLIGVVLFELTADRPLSSSSRTSSRTSSSSSCSRVASRRASCPGPGARC